MAEMLIKLPRLTEQYSSARSMVKLQDELYCLAFLYNQELGGGWNVILKWNGFDSGWQEAYRSNVEYGTYTGAQLFVAPYQFLEGMYENRLFLIENISREYDPASNAITKCSSRISLLDYGCGVGGAVMTRVINFESQAGCQPIVVGNDVYFLGGHAFLENNTRYSFYFINVMNAVDNYNSVIHPEFTVPVAVNNGDPTPIGFHFVNENFYVVHNVSAPAIRIPISTFGRTVAWIDYPGRQQYEEILKSVIFGGTIFAVTSLNRVVAGNDSGDIWRIVVDTTLNANEWYLESFLFTDGNTLFLVCIDWSMVYNFVYSVDLNAHSLIQICPTLNIEPYWPMGQWIACETLAGVQYLLEANTFLVYIEESADFYLWPIVVFGQLLPLRISLVSTFGWKQFDEPQNRPDFDFDYIKNLLCAQDRKKISFQKFCRAFTDVYKKQLPAIIELKNLRNLSRSAGAVLDSNGALVNEPRNFRNDSEYREAILFKIFLLYTTGQADAIILFFKSIAQPDSMRYIESYPAKILIEYTSKIAPKSNLYAMMKKIVAGGVGLRIVWSLNGDPQFACSESGNSGFDDTTTLGCGEVGHSSIGGKMVENIS